MRALWLVHDGKRTFWILQNRSTNLQSNLNLTLDNEKYRFKLRLILPFGKYVRTGHTFFSRRHLTLAKEASAGDRRQILPVKAARKLHRKLFSKWWKRRQRSTYRGIIYRCRLSCLLSGISLNFSAVQRTTHHSCYNPELIFWSGEESGRPVYSLTFQNKSRNLKKRTILIAVS